MTQTTTGEFFAPVDLLPRRAMDDTISTSGTQSPACTSAPADVRLAPEGLTAAFPFHVALDADLAIVQVGRSLQRLDDALRPGVRLSERFETKTPSTPLDARTFASAVSSLCVLEHRKSGLLLRGRVLPASGEARWVLALSPWITDQQEISRHGLTLADFPPDDPVIDLLEVVQAHGAALAEMRMLAQTLKSQRTALRSANARLSAQFDAVQHAEEGRRARESEARRLALVAENTDDAVAICDARGIIQWVNRRFTELSGYTSSEAIGLSRLDLLEDADAATPVLATLADALTRGADCAVETTVRDGDARPHWIEVEVHAVTDDTEVVTNVVFIERDVTDRKRAERRLALRLAVAHTLAEATDAEQACRAMLGAIGSNLGMRVAVLWTLHPDGNTLVCSETWESPRAGAPAYVGLSRRLRIASGEALPGRAWAGGGIEWVRDVCDHVIGPRSNAGELHGLRGGFALPIVWGATTLKVLEFMSDEPEEPDPELKAVLDDVRREIAAFAERRRAEHRVRTLSAEFHAIFQISPDGIVYFRADGSLAYANPAFLTMTGIEPQRLRGLDEPGLAAILATLVDEKRADARHADDDLARDRLHLVRPRRMVLARTVQAIVDCDDRPLGRVIHLRDITHEDEVDRMKSEFLSAAAHELRSPLSSIHGFIELLLHREYPPDRRRDMLATAHRQSKLMVRMIDELLDLARIEARAGHDFRIRSQPLAPIVRDALAPFTVRDDGRRVLLDAPDHAVMVQVDAEKLTQAISNVLSNAVKYSPAGGAVHVRIVERPEDARVGLIVRDQGIGMTPSQVHRVFERFWRADPTGSIPGTGLGMSLVKEMLELMDGSVGIWSEPQRGTEVTLWLRAAPAVPTSAVTNDAGFDRHVV